MKRKSFNRILTAFGVTALLVLLIAILLPALARSGGGPSPMSSTASMAQELWISSLNYQDEFGSYPTGDNAQLLRQLSGENPKELRFLSVGRRWTNSLGQCLDGWRTPYEITISGTNAPIIHSAGTNGKFGDSDDYVYAGPARFHGNQ